jgi:uncharacterized membrane protein YdcZ (DUF606 family)
MSGEEINLPQLVSAGYIAIRGAVGVAFLLLSAAPASAEPTFVMLPVATTTATMITVAYGIMSREYWGWVGGLVAASILVVSDVLLAVFGSASLAAAAVSDLALAGVLVTYRSSMVETPEGGF